MITIGIDVGKKAATIALVEIKDGKRQVIDIFELKAPIPDHWVWDAGEGRQEFVDLTMVQFEWELREQNISPAIIERVLRLNPNPRRGYLLRGIHYKNYDSPRFTMDCTTKGEVLRRFGRDVFDRIPKDRWIRRGRRIWVNRLDVSLAYAARPEPMPEFRQELPPL